MLFAASVGSGTFGAPITLTPALYNQRPTGITIDRNGDIFYADPGTGTIDELLPNSNITSSISPGKTTIAFGSRYTKDIIEWTIKASG